MPDDDKIDKAIAEQQRRERDAAVERARDEQDGGFSDIHGDLMEDEDGVPDHIRQYEVGAGWVDSAEDHAGDN